MDRNHCDYYPANNGIDFTDIVVNGKVEHNTQWSTGYDCGSPDCSQETIPSNDGKTVKLTWNPTPTPTPTPMLTLSSTPGCPDTNSTKDCRHWASEGYCGFQSNYQSYMQLHCCHTCGLCGWLSACGGWGEVQV